SASSLLCAASRSWRRCHSRPDSPVNASSRADAKALEASSFAARTARLTAPTWSAAGPQTVTRKPPGPAGSSPARSQPGGGCGCGAGGSAEAGGAAVTVSDMVILGGGSAWLLRPGAFPLGQQNGFSGRRQSQQVGPSCGAQPPGLLGVLAHGR